jgi:single-strand DNA-binding protein
MEITGRLTADAVVRTVKGDKKVVGFTVAVNDRFMVDGERREVSTFFDCGYFRSEKVAEFLKKGNVVQVFGRVGINAYMGNDGQPRAGLNFHVSDIKLFGASAASVAKSNGSVVAAEVLPEKVPSALASTTGNAGNDDLPF